MRITFLIPGYPWKPVGGIRVAYQYANGLAARGHRVSVVHARRMPPGSFPPDGLAMRARRTADYLRNLLFTPKIGWQPMDPRVQMRFVPDFAPRHVPDADIVIATWWATAEQVLRLPASKGLKCYFIQHFETWGGDEARVQATWRAPLQKIVIARWLHTKGLELGVPPEEIQWIPNGGIDHGVFRVVVPIEERPPRIAMLYSELVWKGGADGIRTLRMVKEQVPEVEAVLFGVDRRPQDLPRWIRYVQRPTQRALVEEVYNGSAIYLCPSWTEGWHLPPAEAMACGCALVTTAMDGVADYALEGETALTSPVRDAEHLAENAVRLLRDDMERIRLARAGESFIRRFNWDHSTDAMEEHLRALLRRERVADPVGSP